MFDTSVKLPLWKWLLNGSSPAANLMTHKRVFPLTLSLEDTVKSESPFHSGGFIGNAEWNPFPREQEVLSVFYTEDMGSKKQQALADGLMGSTKETRDFTQQQT